jgi:hypothetical protein
MMAKTNQRSFDPKAFLAKVGEGKTIVDYLTEFWSQASSLARDA